MLVFDKQRKLIRSIGMPSHQGGPDTVRWELCPTRLTLVSRIGNTEVPYEKALTNQFSDYGLIVTGSNSKPMPISQSEWRLIADAKEYVENL